MYVCMYVCISIYVLLCLAQQVDFFKSLIRQLCFMSRIMRGKIDGEMGGGNAQTK